MMINRPNLGNGRKDTYGGIGGTRSCRLAEGSETLPPIRRYPALPVGGGKVDSPSVPEEGSLRDMEVVIIG